MLNFVFFLSLSLFILSTNFSFIRCINIFITGISNVIRLLFFWCSMHILYKAFNIYKRKLVNEYLFLSFVCYYDDSKLTFDLYIYIYIVLYEFVRCIKRTQSWFFFVNIKYLNTKSNDRWRLEIFCLPQIVRILILIYNLNDIRK